MTGLFDIKYHWATVKAGDGIHAVGYGKWHLSTDNTELHFDLKHNPKWEIHGQFAISSWEMVNRMNKTARQQQRRAKLYQQLWK